MLIRPFNLLSLTRVIMFLLLGSVYYYYICRDDELWLKAFVIIATLLFFINHILLFSFQLQRYQYWLFSLDIALCFLFGLFFAGRASLYLIMFGILSVTLFIMTDKKKILYSYICSFFLLWGVILYVTFIKTHQFNFAENVINFMFIFYGAVVGRLIRKLQLTQQKVTTQYEELSSSHQELSEVYEQLRLYSKQVEDLTMIRERNQIAREIHDTVGHKMTALIVQLQLAHEFMGLDMDKSKEAIQNCESLARNALEDIRTSVRTLHEDDGETTSLLATLQNIIKDFSHMTNTEASLQIQGDPSNIPTSLQPTMTRIIQEALTNSNRHGKATKCDINIDCKQDSILLWIKDDGKGVVQVEPSFGLINMRERVLEHAGSIHYESMENQGFNIKVMFPLKQRLWRTGGMK